MSGQEDGERFAPSIMIRQGPIRDCGRITGRWEVIPR